MDEGTALVLAVQLTALCSIAGSLLLYLMCKARRVYDVEVTRFGSGRSVLITSCENALGLQLGLHLASLGFRVFAGVKDPEASDAGRVLRAKLREVPTAGTLVLVPLDVTREDSLHEAVDTVRRHLPAGQNGLWGVINTAGVVVKGRLEAQESCQWESMFKVNVVGTLRTARVFLPLLKNAKGRLMTIGLSGECRNGTGTGVVAYAAARHAVAGASSAMSQELAHHGISVVTINTGTITADPLYHPVRVRTDEEQAEPNMQPSDPYLKYKVNALPRYALRLIEQALLSDIPKHTYDLVPPAGLSIYFSAITDKLNAEKQPPIINTV